MIATKNDLETKVDRLNDWLKYNPQNSNFEKATHLKTYYIYKLCEMDDNNLDKIKI